ncbi:MAG: oligosaccharide flippase family protein [Gemmatimonadales bacterium]
MRPLRNVLANWAGFLLGTAITFVLSPFVVRHLGDARFGVWGLIAAVVGYLGLLDLGIRVAVTRFVACHEATGDRAAVNRVLSTALALFLAGALAASLLGVVLALTLPGLLHIPPEHAREAAVALALGGVTVGVALISGVYGGAIAGLQRLTILNAIDLGMELLRAAAVYVALKSDGDLTHLAAIQLGVVSLRAGWYRLAVWQLEPAFKTARRLFDRATLREIFRFSAYTMVLHVSGAVIYSSDAVVIASIMPVALVTFFVIAGNLAQAVFRVLGGVTQALYPLVSARQARHGTLATADLLTRTMRLGALAVLPIVITLLVRGPTFIGLWMGPAYAAPAGAILQVLALGLCCFASWHMLTPTLIGLNLHRTLVPAYLGEAASNIALSIVLGLTFGVIGVAWGTTIPRLVLSLAVGPWIARRLLQVPVRAFAVHAWARPFASMIPFALTSLLVDIAWPASNLIVFFVQVALLLPLAAAGAWVVGLERSERALLTVPLNRLLGRVPAAARDSA